MPKLRQPQRDEPRPPEQGNSFWVPEDDAFIQDLRQRLLPDIDRSMSRVLVRDVRNRSKLGSFMPQARAYTNIAEGDPHIYVNAYTPEYRRARGGDEAAQRRLAASLAHENAHIYGKDEPAAYQVELGTLRKLGASEGDIKRVQQALDYVMRRLQHSAK